ncbi:MAG: 3'-5' exonuclease [Pseudonocardia sp.]|nr:3'-5' exonuclease [Pseudonocardia sp.]
MSWADGKLTMIDFETTGKEAETAKIVTCAVVVDEPGFEQLRYEWVAQQEVPDEAAAIHGYSTERCMDEGRPEIEVLGEICEVLRAHWTAADPLGAFNLVYDATVLDRRNIALGGPWPTGPTGQRGGPIIGSCVDPYVLDRTLGRKRRGKRTLNLVCDHYGVQLDEADAHTAIGDVLATLALTRVMARRIPRIRHTDLRQLYRDQQAMHAAWALDMQAFIRGKKREDMVAGREFDGRPVTQEDIDAVIITGHWPIVPRLDIEPVTDDDRTPAR